MAAVEPFEHDDIGCGKIFSKNRDVKEGLDDLGLGDEARPFNLHDSRRVLRKIDLFLIPAMVIGMYSL